MSKLLVIAKWLAVAGLLAFIGVSLYGAAAAKSVEQDGKREYYFGHNAPALRDANTVITIRPYIFRRFKERGSVIFSADKAAVGGKSPLLVSAGEQPLAVTVNLPTSSKYRKQGLLELNFTIPAAAELSFRLDSAALGDNAIIHHLNCNADNWSGLTAFAAAIVLLVVLLLWRWLKRIVLFIKSKHDAAKNRAVILDVDDLTLAEQKIGIRTVLIRAALVFVIVAAALLAWRVAHPSQYDDALLFDYSAVSAEHAVTFAERMNGTPNNGNLNINSHPGLPYYVAQGVARYLSVGAVGATPVERTVHFFQNVEMWWRAQAALGILLTAFGAALLAVYCRAAPLLLVLALAAFPLTLADTLYCGYLQDLTNETFALPVIALFLLVARVALSPQISWRKLLPALLALGFIAGVAYTIKLPYIIVFIGGAVVPLLRGWREKSCRQAAVYLGIYIAGFIALMLAAVAAFGPAVVGNFLKYHYGVLTHTGFAGGGEDGITSAQTLKDNFFGFTVPLWRDRLLWFWGLAAMLAALMFFRERGRQSNSWKMAAVIFTLYLGNVAATTKHPYGYHYALLQPILLAFLVYELARPLLLLKNLRFTAAVTILALTVAAVAATPRVVSAAAKVDALPSVRAECDRFIAQIKALPLQENEGVYFQWGAHNLPYFLTAHSLEFCYLTPARFTDEVMLKLFNEPAWEFAGTYRDRRRDIRYMVIGNPNYSVEFSPDEKEPQKFVWWDMPYQRLMWEPNDRVVLRADLSSEYNCDFLVIEKARPIAPDEE
ncbi:MAG: hypothetical protein LBP75_10860 [Planctomycetota bacterium]|nr:hypothetical protein [Planctomycetota bacterium]